MDNNEVFNLIDGYRRLPILWDTKNPKYMNRNLREDAWKELSEISRTSVKDVKKKIASLLGSYRREKSRHKSSLVTGSGGDDVYKSKWFAYDLFKQFLGDKSIPKDTMDTLESKDENPEEGAASQRLDVDEPAPEIRPTEESHSMDEEGAQKRKRKRSSDPQNEMFLEAFQILKKSSSNVPIEDAFNSFALHVANEMRKYDERILPYVKREILNVLFKADTGGFNHLISSSPAIPSTFSTINHPLTSHNPTPSTSTTTLHHNYCRTSTMSAPPSPTTPHTITFDLDEEMLMIDHQEEL
ncbi:uncharacterized protein LOC111054211 [Nilaparvata lugens]|uniref:uncharacterized protein LOC111054211 n=1 Tax=Nilaparvata lugens TaxID=108931 RepID=UPI00193D1002|nr:uncharacterized protein LOC111054211 [Nilaparvata lugens]